MRSKIFRQDAQMKRGKAIAFPRFFGLSDGARRKQGVRRELCGATLIFYYINTPMSMVKPNLH